ncbi:hypothetical protein ABPG74_010175 [Tetrahymena malaccensis]
MNKLVLIVSLAALLGVASVLTLTKSQQSLERITVLPTCLEIQLPKSHQDDFYYASNECVNKMKFFFGIKKQNQETIDIETPCLSANQSFKLNYQYGDNMIDAYSKAC